MLNTEKNNIFIYILLAGLVTELYYLAFLLFNDENIPLYMFIYLETFLIMLFSFYFVKNLNGNNSDGENEKNKKHNFVLLFFSKALKIKNPERLKLPLTIIFFGLFFRLTLFPALPTTSNDVYRYLWEGKVLAAGYNPFTLAPNDTSLIPLRDEVYSKVTFKDISAIYPPISQFVFAAGYGIKNNSVAALKLIYLLCELFTLLILLKLLDLKKKNLNYIILYAWLPLSIMEYFINAHLDPIGIMFMIMFIYFMEREKLILSSVVFSLAILSKLYPIILFPLVIKKLGLKKTFVFALLTAILVITLFVNESITLTLLLFEFAT